MDGNDSPLSRFPFRYASLSNITKISEGLEVYILPAGSPALGDLSPVCCSDDLAERREFYSCPDALYLEMGNSLE